jgi:hypothetical protein
MLLYTFFKTNVLRTLMQFLIIVELAFLFDTIIYTFLNSYVYHPGFIKHSEYHDSNMGGLTSNLLAIPVAATFLAVFNLKWMWDVVFIIIIGGVEWLFIKLQIYTVYWWKVAYTSIGLMAYFPVARKIYTRISRPVSGWLHSLFLFLCTAPLLGTLHILPIIFFLNRYYHPGWYTNPDRDTSAISALYYLASTMVIVLAVKIRWNHLWIKFLLLVVFFFLITAILKATGILDIRAGWDPWFYSLMPASTIYISRKFSERLMWGEVNNSTYGATKPRL